MAWKNCPEGLTLEEVILSVLLWIVGDADALPRWPPGDHFEEEYAERPPVHTATWQDQTNGDESLMEVYFNIWIKRAGGFTDTHATAAMYAVAFNGFLTGLRRMLKALA